MASVFIFYQLRTYTLQIAYRVRPYPKWSLCVSTPDGALHLASLASLEISLRVERLCLALDLSSTATQL